MTERTPLFTATVNQKGQITIRSDVRRDKNIKTGDRVRVYEIEKVKE